jgi:amino acid transporter
VLLIFILPALAISWVVPAQELSLTAGVMQAFSAFFSYFGIDRLVPIVALALVCASLGGMLTWLAGPSKGLVLIGRREGYLPPFLQKVNDHDVPINILLTQGALTTVIGLLYALIPSVSSAYWILSVMTTQVYLIMYVLMFIAARRLRTNQPNVKRGFKAPWLTLMCAVGGASSAAAFIIGFVPPSQFGSSSTVVYVLIILAGTGLIGLLPAWLFLRFRKPDWKGAEAAVAIAGAGATEGGPEPAAAAAAVPPSPQPVEATPAQAGEAPETPPMPETAAEESSDSVGDGLPKSGHRSPWIYWGAGALVVAGIVVGLLAYTAHQHDQQAHQKAQQLEQKFKAAGLALPASTDQIVGSLGTDGGAVCQNPANALGKATLNSLMTNGASFVGQRPVIFDRRILVGEVAILQVYCPEKLEPYQDKINNLKTRDTVKR